LLPWSALPSARAPWAGCGALETGNLSPAQTLFASMAPRGSQGVNVTV